MLKKEYRELFAMVARNGAINGENAIELANSKDGDNDYFSDDGIEGTAKMVKAFRELEDKILKGEEELTGLDYTFLWVGATVTRTTLEKNITRWTAVLHEYDENLVPKLYEIAQMPDGEDKDKKIDEMFNERVKELNNKNENNESENLTENKNSVIINE